MDKDTRNAIERATQRARKLLNDDFVEQLAGDFDVHQDGTAAEGPGEHLKSKPREISRRQKIVAAIEHKRAAGMSAAEAVVDYVRDAAFTTLNRFVALKMLEARELVQECITKGEQSAGYREFCGMAPGVALLPESTGYRLYIESLFDELSTEVKVLFDRRDPASVLWPKRATFEALLDVLNATDVAGVWREDETIGWIYQYYNDPAERKKMRDESAAPRNSRELAVRNQFFTPRYVVEFLSDNTLGRIWYEMTNNRTRLKDQCRYLVLRPHESFLQPGEAAPVAAQQDNLSQEQLFQQAVHIPHRPLKDPREIRMLDPACGSMHFGLYAFDLFEVIYDEAWEIVHGGDEGRKSSANFATFVSFVAQYPNKFAFLADVPRLIIEHNLHGIDIDPRAAQIAGLSLWLRAQRNWQQHGLRPQDRPRIRRSNIVCAEAMPGEERFLDEFIEAHLSAVTERKLLAQLVRRVFDAMKLAGEAGSLLKIEEEIAGAVAEAKQKWLAGPKPEQARLFVDDTVPPTQRELGFDVTGITDETFWEKAEERIYAALQSYAEQAEHGGGYQRSLFANDAARGFAFNDLCRKRYDVVLMNPPFGDSSADTETYLSQAFPSWNKNLLCAFLARAASIICKGGKCGAIFDRTAIIKSTYETFRREVLLKTFHISSLADLGWEVLDANVETVSLVCDIDQNTANSDCFDVRDRNPLEKGSVLSDLILSPTSSSRRILNPETFKALPNAVIGYDIPQFVLRSFRQYPSLDSGGAKAHPGLQLKMDAFGRLRAEVNPNAIVKKDFVPMYNGGIYSPFYMPIIEMAYWRGTGAHLLVHPSTRWNNGHRYFQPGIGYGKRGNAVDSHVLPAGCLFTIEGLALFPSDIDSSWYYLGLTNSRLISVILSFFSGQHKHAGYVDLLPIPAWDSTSTLQAVISTKAKNIHEIKRADDCFNEVSTLFYCDRASALKTSISNAVTASRQVAIEITRLQGECNESVEKLFQLDKADSEFVKLRFSSFVSEDESSDEGLGDSRTSELESSAFSVMSYGLGCAFGRWDIRFAISEKPIPDLPDPFLPLPVCSPGQLLNEQGLPFRQEYVPAGYPVLIPWDGIMADDLGYPLDIEARVQQVLQVIWKDRWETIEREACEILGVRTLRDYFRKPAGFFAEHLKRYSKSRRQAPIYWPLSTASGSYTLWLYYHRLSQDTLYQAAALAKDKLAHEERRLDVLGLEYGSNPTATQRKELASQEAFVAELRGYHEEIARVAPLWRPDLNDGVILNYGPLWRLISHRPWQKSVKEAWDGLCTGEYDWAHLAMHLWPARVVPKCATDRSIAIAHDLENEFWAEGSDGKWKPRTTPLKSVEQLVRERSSPAVKAALKSLLDAPTASGKGRARGRRAASPAATERGSR